MRDFCLASTKVIETLPFGFLACPTLRMSNLNSQAVELDAGRNRFGEAIVIM